MRKSQRSLKVFLTTVLALGFLMLSGQTSLEKTAGSGFRFVFMTDIHVQPEKEGVKGFTAAVDRVNELEPDFVITGGDLIMDALETSYGRADTLYGLFHEVTEGLKMPVYHTMGNHDILGWSDESTVDEAHPEFGKKIFKNRIGEPYYSFNYGGWHFLVLDSVEEGDSVTYKGGVDSVQMDWIRNDLAGTRPEVPIIVSVHIPFFSMETQIFRGVMEPNPVWAVINNANEVLELFKDHNLKLVLQGHQHILEAIYVRDTWFITGGAVSGAWWSGPWDETEEGFLLISVEGDEIAREQADHGREAAADDEEW